MYNKEYYQNHRESLLQNQRRYYETHREQSNSYSLNYYKEHKEELRAYGREYSQIHKLWKASRLKLKTEVLTHYGNGKLACVHCGFNDIRALSIDHIEGNGAEFRRESHLFGLKLYRWLKAQGYPKGYQTLCMNCQFIKKDTNFEYKIRRELERNTLNVI